MGAGNAPLIDPRSRHAVGGYADPTPAQVIGWGRQTAVILARDDTGLRAVVVDPYGIEFDITYEHANSGRKWFGTCSCGGRDPRHTCEHLRHVYGRHIRDQQPK